MKHAAVESRRLVLLILLALAGLATVLLLRSGPGSTAGRPPATAGGRSEQGPAGSAPASTTGGATPAAERAGTPAPEVVLAPRGPRQTATITRVVDGDTVWVSVSETGGELPPAPRHRVRLLEIDSPELTGPSGAQECGAAAATAALAALAPEGTGVVLEADREDTDRYGRYLRYLWTPDGRFINAELVRQGHARAVLYPPNDAHIDALRALEAQARADGLGIWSQACADGLTYDRWG